MGSLHVSGREVRAGDMSVGQRPAALQAPRTEGGPPAQEHRRLWKQHPARKAGSGFSPGRQEDGPGHTLIFAQGDAGGLPTPTAARVSSVSVKPPCLCSFALRLGSPYDP